MLRVFVVEGWVMLAVSRRFKGERVRMFLQALLPFK
jgi:hypothetical protein